MMVDAREELQRAHGRLREAIFPRDSVVSDDLSDLHAELAEYDGHVAGVASSLLGGAPVEPSLLARDAALEERLERAAGDSDGSARDDAEAYLAYYRLLDEVLAAARRSARR
jgi:hypothetical protein